MSLLRKLINIKSDLTEIFTPTDRGYVDSKPASSSGLSVTTSIVNVTTTATTIASANSDRLNIQIQNHGLVPVIIKLGGNPITTDYHFVLTQASDVRLGDGGVYDNTTSKLSIVGITETGTADISVLEEVI